MCLGKLANLFRRESTAHMHPKKKGDFCRRVENVLQEASRSYHVKVSFIIPVYTHHFYKLVTSS